VGRQKGGGGGGGRCEREELGVCDEQVITRSYDRSNYPPRLANTFSQSYHLVLT